MRTNKSLANYAVIIGGAVLLLIGACGDDGAPAAPSTSSGPSGRLFALNQSDATMFVFDTETMSITDTVDTHVAMPHYIEFSPDGMFFYIVTLENNGHIAKFDALTYAFIDSISVPLGVRPSAIAITADGRYGYVCNFSLSAQRTFINKFDLSSMTLVGSSLAGAMTHDLKITGDGSLIIACNQYSDDLTLLYTDADTVVRVSIDPDRVYPVGSNKYGPFGVVIDSRDSLAYVACMDAHQVRTLDIAAQTIVDSVDIPVDTSILTHGPTLLAISPDDQTVFLTTQSSNTVVVIDVSTMQVIKEISQPTPFPFGISMSADGSRLYTACINRSDRPGSISIIDTKTLSIIKTVEVGHQSFGLTWQPVSQ